MSKIAKRLSSGLTTLLRDQKGTSLLDTLLALATLGTIGSIFISALFSGYRTSGDSEY